MMKILIADDDIPSLALAEASLSYWGYAVVSATDGNEAWEVLQQEKAPRLVLLDWMMPGINGIELCKKLKSKKNSPYIYIILLTAKSEKEDIITGFKAGADDFVAKPFDSKELRSRLEVGSRILKYEAELNEKNEQLAKYASQMETIAEERARQLVHSDRMATLGVMSAGIAHEIQNPLTFISSSIQLLEKFWIKSLGHLQECIERDCEYSKSFKFVLENTSPTIDGARKGIKRISNIVRGLNYYAHKDTGEKSSCSINHCIEGGLQICHNVLKYHVKVEKQLGENLPEINANVQQIEQVLINLFVNAAHAMESQRNGLLKIITYRKDQLLCVVVEDTGPGIPDDKIEQIWDTFYTTKEVGKGTGLGLSISRGIIRDHAGTIRAENNPVGGARFVIELPLKNIAT